MTKISYTRFPKAQLTVNGHCEAERTNGNDLCCAAVSALVCTLLQRLEEIKPEHMSIYCADGYAEVQFSSRGRKGRLALETLDTILAGLRLIEADFNQNIKIKGGKK